MSDLVKCPYCMHMNLAERETCEACGAVLRDVPTLAAVNTDKLEDIDGVEQHISAPVTTRIVEPGPEHNEPRWGGASIDDRTRLLAHVIHHDRSVALNLSATGSLLLGRQQLGETQEPKLDLAEFDALEAGVSRQHARFELRDYSLYITDLDSTNGTYLNGLRILPWQPRVVRDGDEVRLGRLKLQILFMHTPEGQDQDVP